jgi:hypothetical protein
MEGDGPGSRSSFTVVIKSYWQRLESLRFWVFFLSPWRTAPSFRLVSRSEERKGGLGYGDGVKGFQVWW